MAQLALGEADLLHARFAGTLPVGADVENALLYNIGGFAQLLANGVRFEMDSGPSPRGVRYIYEAADHDGGFAHWERERTVAHLRATPLPDTGCSAVWWALGGAAVEVAREPAPVELFGVRLIVGMPTMTLTPERVKGLVDGVVCALQAQESLDAARAVAPRLASGLGVTEEAIATRLADRAHAVLGVLHDLRRPTGWNPADHRCVAGELRVKRATEWSVAGDVVTVVPV
jgi:hypothetical protein